MSTPQLSMQQESTSSSSTIENIANRTRTIQNLYDVIRRLVDNEDFTIFCLFSASDPIHFEATQKEDIWRQAMNEKIQAIKRNNKAISVKWVYKTKSNAKGDVE